MNDFHPVTMFFIAREMFGTWLWVLIALALILLYGIVSGIMRLRAADAAAGRPLGMGLLVGLLVTAAVFFLLPMWSGAPLSAINGGIDYAIGILLALIPGAIAGTAVFSVASRHCARRHRARRA